MLARELTTGERLRVARRREGQTQAQAAAEFELPLHAYKQLEADEPSEWAVSAPPLGRLAAHEVYTLRRRRAGLTQDELAAKIGVSKWWLCLMEQGKAPIDTLSEYWART